MNDQDFILYEPKGRIATITINRPDKANSCNVAMLKLLHENLIEADRDEKVRCIILKSIGEKFFSAGYDLKDIQGSPEKAAQITVWGRKINETIVLGEMFYTDRKDKVLLEELKRKKTVQSLKLFAKLAKLIIAKNAFQMSTSVDIQE